MDYEAAISRAIKRKIELGDRLIGRLPDKARARAEGLRGALASVLAAAVEGLEGPRAEADRPAGARKVDIS
jgi:hypothetical protein